jgi:hypothetical protein
MDCKNAAIALLAGANLLGPGCHQGPPPKIYTGGPLPIGEDIYLRPANYSLSFHAKPGESYRVRSEWPTANVVLVTGSDFRGPTADDDDDASNIQKAQVEPAGAHGQQAKFVVGPQADTTFIHLNTVGDGSGPMLLRIERGP